MAKKTKKLPPASKECESLVDAILKGKNIEASKKLESLMKSKAAKRIKEVLDDK